MQKRSSPGRTSHLSSKERETGVKYFVRYSFFNGAGFAFMADTTVTLLALHFGATNTQLGYLASVIHISGLVLPFVPTLLGGMVVVDVFYWSWLLRGFVCFLYLLTPLVPPGNAIGLILAVYTVFCIVRVIGASLSQAIQHTLTPDGNTGELVARLSYGFGISTLIAKLLSVGLLRLHILGEVAGLLTLQLMGIGCNTVAAGNLRRIPGREVLQRRPGQSIFVTFVRRIRERETALVLLLNWSSLCIGILMGFTVPLLRRSAGMSDSMIFVYSVAATLAAIAAAVVIKPFGDRVGSKPLLIVCSGLVVFLCAGWAIVPASLNRFLYVAFGFVSAFFLSITGLLTGRLLIRSIPEDDKIGYTSMVSFFSALVALGMGYAAGLLADAGAGLRLPLMNAYGAPFAAAGVLALATGVLAAFLRDTGSMSLREAIGVLSSTRNLRAFLDIYQLETTRDPARRESVQASLEHSDTALATAEIGSWLRNPLPMEKERALRSLFSHPRKELYKDILEEAGDLNSCNREQALFALGAYPGEATEKVLLKSMDDPNPLIRSVAAKSLARVGNASLLQQVRAWAQEAGQPPEVRLNYLIALMIMDKEAGILCDLFTYAAPVHGARFEQAAFSVCANRLDMTPSLAGYYHRENMSAGRGCRDLLAEARELEVFLVNSQQMLKLYRQAKFADLWAWCSSQIANRAYRQPLQNLAAAIVAHDPAVSDRANTLAVLYFTYQLLRRQGETRMTERPPA